MHNYMVSAILVSSLGLVACMSDDRDSDKIDVDKALKNSTQLETYLKKGLIDDMDGQWREFDDTAVETAQDSTSGTSQPNFGNNSSTTNTQEDKVDEADLVKQNGDYLYAYSPRHFSASQNETVDNKQAIRVYRTHTNPLRSTLAGDYELPQHFYEFHGMFLHDQGLITLSQQGTVSIYHGPAVAIDATVEPVSASADLANINPVPTAEQALKASLTFLNLDNPAQPEKQSQLEFEGEIVASRRVGNFLYVVNRFQPLVLRTQDDYRDQQQWVRKVIDTPLEKLLPRYWVNGELKGTLFDGSGCYLPDLQQQGGYHNIVTLLKIDLSNPASWQAKCSSGRVNDVYASENGLFLAAGYYHNGTRIDQFSMDDLALQASGRIPGFLQWPMPALRMSEKDGYLRVLVSNRNFSALPEPIDSPVTLASDTVSNGDNTPPSWAEAHHRLYVLKANAQQQFDQIAVIPNRQQTTIIGKPGEQVKSVRFRGDRAYIVTFRQTDPLYVINLSQADKPFVEGELEIEGFSQYLHPLSDTLLLGLGIDANSAGRTQGLKATLFDVSNPATPTEISSQLFADDDSHAAYLYDHKAVNFLDSADQQTTRVAFTWSHWNGARINHLRIIDINKLSKSMNLVTDHVYANGGEQSYERYSRAALHGDGVHLVRDGDVTSGPVNSFQ